MWGWGLPEGKGGSGVGVGSPVRMGGVTSDGGASLLCVILALSSLTEGSHGRGPRRLLESPTTRKEDVPLGQSEYCFRSPHPACPQAEEPAGDDPASGRPPGRVWDERAWRRGFLPAQSCPPPAPAPSSAPLPSLFIPVHPPPLWPSQGFLSPPPPATCVSGKLSHCFSVSSFSFLSFLSLTIASPATFSPTFSGPVSLELLPDPLDHCPCVLPHPPL